MDKIDIFTNDEGIEIVVITKEDNSIVSMLKSTWDEQQAANEAQSLQIVLYLIPKEQGTL